MKYNADVSTRLKRIEGQVRGVGKMVEDGRDCTDIVQQLKAIQAAITSAKQMMIKEYLFTCINLDGGSNLDKEEMSRLFGLLEN